jgi:type IV fimbrial biogenesis protein FimT
VKGPPLIKAVKSRAVRKIAQRKSIAVIWCRNSRDLQGHVQVLKRRVDMHHNVRSQALLWWQRVFVFSMNFKMVFYKSRPRGLTLIEVMVALVISAVLLAIAAPDFREAIWRARLSTVSMDIVSAIQLARAEAVRQNARAVLCASTDNSSCTAASATWAGWIVFVDSNNDGTRDAAEPVIKAGSFPANATVKASAAITAVNQRITFGADGVARAADGRTLLTGILAACVAETRPAENVRDVSLAFGVRTAVRRRAAAGACGTPADL